MAPQTTACLEEVTLECTHCGVLMVSYLGSGSKVRYAKCNSCHRWVSSTYADVLRFDSGVRAHKRVSQQSAESHFSAVKKRLEAFLAHAESALPHRKLNVAVNASEDEIRQSYRKLALLNHPDRGGSEQSMREINAAYEKLIAQRAKVSKHS